MMVTMTKYHTPVLLQESINRLVTEKNGVYVDVTFGGGGHTRHLLEQLGKQAKVFGFDRDSDAASDTVNDERFKLIRHDYRWIDNFLAYYKAVPVSGILADLGVSSHQLDTAERGFSFRQEAELDLRMDQDIETSAKDVVNQYPEHKIQQILTNYGELKNAKTLAREICSTRANSNIESTAQLCSVIDNCLRKSDKRNKFYSQVFQALRIEVNQEFRSLEIMLEKTADLLKPKGRLVVITYHSLEDRIVKNFIQKGKFRGQLEKDFYGNPLKPLDAVTRKPILPSVEEIEENPRARSAKLRIAEKRHEQD